MNPFTDDLQIARYPKVYALGHRAIADLFADGVDPLVVQEKVDGSQFSFGLAPNGQLRIRSKDAMIDPENPPKMFGPAVETVRSLLGLLEWNTVYRAEAVCRPKHNVLGYDRTPNGGLVLFDVQYPNPTPPPDRVVPVWDFASPSALTTAAYHLGLESVPLLTLTTDDLQDLQAWLQRQLVRESFLGGVAVEGVVIKHHNRFGPDGMFLAGKCVSEQFKEQHRNEWKTPLTSKGDLVGRFVATINKPAYWQKAVARAQEQDQLEFAPQDIPKIIKLAGLDMASELRDSFKDFAERELWSDVQRRLLKGTAEWYKQWLVAQQPVAPVSTQHGEQ